MDDLSVDVGQTSLDSIVVEGQTSMVQAQQVQNGRVQIVHGGDVFDRLVPELVGRTVAEAWFDTRPGQPDGKAGRIVVAAAGTFLKGRHTTKLRTPNDERIFQQPALF